MGYRSDFSKLDMDYVKRRLEGVEPIPSQAPLLVSLGAKLAALKKAGVSNLEELSASLRNEKGRLSLSKATGIGEDYLKLLARAVEGMRPKPRELDSFPGIPPAAAKALHAAGIDDSGDLFEAARGGKGLASLAKGAGVPPDELKVLYRMADLCRIQWVGPAYARLLLDAGYESPVEIASADPESLRAAVAAANAKLALSKTDIGLKDSARLVALAGFLVEADS